MAEESNEPLRVGREDPWRDRVVPGARFAPRSASLRVHVSDGTTVQIGERGTVDYNEGAFSRKEPQR